MSRKLEDNGRWESSRMMLPEHREAYLQRRRGGAEREGKSRIPTREELEWIRDAVLLPIMLTIVDKNRSEIELSSYSMKSLYIAASHALMKRIHADLAAVKRSLKERDIRLFEEERVDSALHYRFVCRGYEDSFAIMRDVARAEIGIRIARYVAELFR
jgi:hypothetical protein